MYNIRMNIEKFKLFKDCLDHWGATSQILMAIEEMCELSVELLHSLRANKPFDIDKLTEEIADVSFIIEQLMYLLAISGPDLESMKKQRMKRVRNLLEAEKEMRDEDAV